MHTNDVDVEDSAVYGVEEAVDKGEEPPRYVKGDCDGEEDGTAGMRTHRRDEHHLAAATASQSNVSCILLVRDVEPT